jgi:hypothetical protein
MSLGGLAAAREALGAGEPEKLLGLAECAWLDVKGGVYDLDSPYGAEELLKDVAAFANAREGGLLLVGFATQVEDGQEVIDRVRPVPRERVDLDRHRKLLDRIVPVPLHVRVDWVGCGQDKGILVIDVPVQPAACLPFLVPGPARTGKVSCPAFLGQEFNGYFTLLPGHLGIHPGPPAESCTRALSGDGSYCTGARSIAQYPSAPFSG